MGEHRQGIVGADLHVVDRARIDGALRGKPPGALMASSP
jgi:hypothetical protein